MSFSTIGFFLIGVVISRIANKTEIDWYSVVFLVVSATSLAAELSLK